MSIEPPTLRDFYFKKNNKNTLIGLNICLLKTHFNLDSPVTLSNGVNYDLTDKLCIIYPHK